ncbi:MAG: glycosyltransferase [Actinomycetota bacterium]|nr:glycosyltransferase [Actinomycetota bacterium]
MSSVSVVLCTFDGADFLATQLDSLAGQTCPPDEIVVRDDASHDATREVLDDFAHRSAVPVRISVNQQRLGIPANFWAAIGDARGDLIALCDQDDVWHPSRLQRAIDVLDDDPHVGATFSNGRCIDERGASTGQTLWELAGLTEDVLAQFRSGHELDVLLRRPVVTGATVTFRSSLLTFLRPAPPITHDYWISAAIASKARVKPIDEPLISYRLHASNAIGLHPTAALPALARHLRDRGLRQETLAHQFHLRQALLERADQAADPLLAPATRQRIDRELDLLRFQLALPDRFIRRLPLVLGRVRSGAYASGAIGRFAWERDLFLL